MKQALKIFAIAALVFVSVQNHSIAQAPSLGLAASFALFNNDGNVNNNGTSQITGNIGTNNGSLLGFGPPTSLTGNMYTADGFTAQSSLDLKATCNFINDLVPTSTTHSPVFGNGETLTPGVYLISDAASLAGSLTLDAAGDPDAVFIIKILGTFSAANFSNINLANGAKACNVFWKMEKDVSLGTNTNLKGNFIAHNSAISLGAGSSLEGRLFSTSGNMVVDGVTVIIPACSILPIALNSFTGNCYNNIVLIKWSTLSESNSSHFTIESSNNALNWQNAGSVRAAGNSSTLLQYSFRDSLSAGKGGYYRLKQTDINGYTKYSNTIFVKKCNAIDGGILSVYPNPSTGQFTLSLPANSNLNAITNTEVFNASGEKIYGSTNFQSTLNLAGYTPGIYFLRINGITGKSTKLILTK